MEALNREGRSFEQSSHINRRSNNDSARFREGNNNTKHLRDRELEQASQQFRAKMAENTNAQFMDKIAASQLKGLDDKEGANNNRVERTVQTDTSGRTIERLVHMDSGSKSNNATQVVDRVLNDNKTQENNGPAGDKGIDKAGKGEKSEDKESSRQMDNEIDSLIGLIENLIAKLGNSEATRGLKADLEKLLVELKSVKGDSVPVDKKSSVITQAQSVLAKLL